MYTHRTITREEITEAQIGAVLFLRREMTQREIARHIGISPSGISNMLARRSPLGLNPMVNLSHLAFSRGDDRLAKLLSPTILPPSPEASAFGSRFLKPVREKIGERWAVSGDSRS